ncbi:MAG: hypothetical protein HZB22_07215 [Deltaproteobacteria bacterium]|nr:hypothetical protein [Deltaproteobacteria bacterium]
MTRLLNRHGATHAEKPNTSDGDIVTISEEGKKKHILGQVRASISESGKVERRGRGR